MKNLILLFLFSLFICACKKNYNCRCSTTVIQGYTQDYYVSKTKPISQKTTKKQAKAICDHEADDLNTTYYNTFTNNGNRSANGAVATTNCILE